MDGHIIFEHYTNMDRNIDELAKVKGNCLYFREHKLCSRSCDNCSVNNKLGICYRELSLCDQLRLDRYAEEVYAQREYFHNKHMTRTKQQMNIIKFVVIVGLVVLLLLMGGILRAQSYTLDYYKDDWRIKHILQLTHIFLDDVNGDYTINCIDYAVTFKILWDENYPPELCTIVRNKNPRNGFHHLFNAVKGVPGSKWLYVEPQVFDRYKMSDVWCDMYDDMFNRVLETDKWLNERR